MEEKTKNEKKPNIFIRVKNKVKEKLDNIGEFAADNPQLIGGIFSAIGTVIVGGAMFFGSMGERNLKKCEIQDENSGISYYTVRPLSYSERVELVKASQNGQTTIDFLEERDLLRK